MWHSYLYLSGFTLAEDSFPGRTQAKDRLSGFTGGQDYRNEIEVKSMRNRSKQNRTKLNRTKWYRALQPMWSGITHPDQQNCDRMIVNGDNAIFSFGAPAWENGT
jgi:nuclear transport factor 2 (NTF2) superfamily protein